MKTTLYVSTKTFSELFFFESFIILFMFLGHWLVFSCLSGKRFLPCLSKLKPIWLEEQFKEKFLSKETTEFLSLSENGRKNLGTVGNYFRLGCHNCMLRVCRNFQTFRFFNVVGLWTNIFLPSVDYLSTGCRNCFLVVARNILGENSFWNRMSFLSFSHIQRNFLWPSSIFFLTWRCLNCSLLFHKKLFWKNSETNTFPSFWDIEQNFFLSNSPTEFRILNFTCSWEKVTKRIVFEKNFSIPSHGQKTCLLFVETFPTWLWKPHYRCPHKHF